MLFQDMFNQMDMNPQAMGTMANYLLAAAQPSTQPTSTGEALMGGMSALQAQQQQAKMKEMFAKALNPPAQNPQQPQTYPFSQAANVNSPNANTSQGFNLFPEDKEERLAMLRQQAQQAFPDNPTMQQVAMTQAIHESGLMGKPSGLAQQGNLFGIKAPGTAGNVNMNTQEFAGGVPYRTQAAFGANANIGDSFNQYRNLLNNKRYTNVAQAQNPQAAFGALQQAGYATDPEYSKKLGRVYNQYVAPLYTS